MSIDPAAWFQIKELARYSTGWPMSTLHVLGGVLLQLLSAALLRTSLQASGRGWSCFYWSSATRCTT